METRQRPRYHGRDHLPGGPDPIYWGPGVLVGYGSLDTVLRDPGGLTLWYRLGEDPGYPTTPTLQLPAFLDSAQFSGSPATPLEYWEDNTDGDWSASWRPTFHVAGATQLGIGDDGAISFPNAFISGIGGHDFPYVYAPSGINSYVEWGTTGDAARSYMVWFKYSASSSYSAPIIGNWGMDGTGSINTGWVLQIDPSTGQLDFLINAPLGSNSVTQTGLVADTWYMAVMTWDGATMKLYVNGILSGSAAQTHAPGSPAGLQGNLTLNYGNYDFGVSYKSHTFKGSIDELATWKVPLTLAQIQAIYAGAGLSTSTTLATHIGSGAINNPAAVGSGSAVQYEVMTADGAGGTVFARPRMKVRHNGV